MVARPLSTTWSILGDEDQRLLSFYETTASRMITTIDDDANGFRHVLIGMAFSGSSDSSAAIVEAMLAFSACQLYGGDAASVHNAVAVRALSKSIETSSAPQDRLCQLAASMLLVTFGVFHFNKSIKTYAQKRCEEDPYLSAPSSQTTIIGSSGCSMELMSVIARLNDITLSADGSDLDTQQTQLVDQLESQLSSLRQFLVLHGSLDSMLDENAVLKIAELYRLAALAAASKVESIVGGKLDYLINNGALLSQISAFKSLADFPDDPDLLVEDLASSFRTNVIGVVQTVNAFVPLLRKGTAKKVLTLSTGLADTDLINQIELAVSGPYAISKAAVNMVVAHYNALYKKEGFLFMAISPGVVDTGNAPDPSNEEAFKGMMDMGAKFAGYAPHFKGPIQPDESVASMLKILENASIEKGDGGSFISHLGNKQWL
ncbi:MAG: hypothetical protein Q9195_006338 [Heterodermia aff. obscurata]